MNHNEVIRQVWPDWQVKEIIGRGSYGVVFRAVKEKFGVEKESAIKVVRIPTDETQVAQVQQGFGLDVNGLKDYFYPEVEKLKEEVVLMEKLGEDPHCLQIQDFDILEDPEGNVGWYILIRMELLESLESKIRRGSMRLGDVISLGEDILSALETCEAHRIIHRDIKPANIFVNQGGVYKLGDFGIAKDLTLESRNLSHKGTDNYAAPEVCQGKEYSSNIDIYSLGLVLYQLLNKNKRPFFGEGKVTAIVSEEAYRKRQMGERFPLPAYGDGELFSIIEKMCAYNPGERFQRACEAKKALEWYRERHVRQMNEVLWQGAEPGTAIPQRREQPHKIYNEGQNTPKPVQRPGFERNNTAEREYQVSEAGSYIENNASEGYTRSLHRTERRKIEQSIDTGSFSNNPYPNVQQILQEANQAPVKKKSKISMLFAAASLIVVVLVGLAVFANLNIQRQEDSGNNVAGSDKKGTIKSKFQQYIEQNEDSNNATRLAKAKEIADSPDVFEIDKDTLDPEVYINYTTGIWSNKDNVMKDRDGIYIGELNKGVPDGYGVFCYQSENTNDEYKAWFNYILLGEWEKGSLRNGESVEERCIVRAEYTDGTNILAKGTSHDEWKDGRFVHEEAEGSYYYHKTWKKDDQLKENEWTFTGTVSTRSVAVAVRGTKKFLNGDVYEGEFQDDILVKGKKHKSDGTVYDGEFRDGIIYNGTCYDADGKLISKITNGVWE